MKKVILFLLVLFVLFITGCNKSNNHNGQVTADELKVVKEEFRNEITRLQEELSLDEEKIKALEDKIVEVEAKSNDLTLFQDSSFQNLSNDVAMVEQLVKRLPQITRKQGYIKEVVNEEGGLFFMIDYADMVTDEDAPNHFHIDNDIEKFEKLLTDKNISTYTLNDEVSGLEFANAEAFNKTLKKHIRLFNLYFIEGEVALVVEQYLP